MATDLRSRLVRLAFTDEALRPHLLPILASSQRTAAMTPDEAKSILGRTKHMGRGEYPVARGWKESGYTRADLDTAAATLGMVIRKVTGLKGSVLLCGPEDE